MELLGCCKVLREDVVRREAFSLEIKKFLTKNTRVTIQKQHKETAPLLHHVNNTSFVVFPKVEFATVDVIGMKYGFVCPSIARRVLEVTSMYLR